MKWLICLLLYVGTGWGMPLGVGWSYNQAVEDMIWVDLGIFYFAMHDDNDFDTGQLISGGVQLPTNKRNVLLTTGLSRFNAGQKVLKGYEIGLNAQIAQALWIHGGLNIPTRGVYLGLSLSTDERGR